MRRLRIIHETAYRYREPVRFGQHRLVIRPREGHDVRVEEMKIEISPEFRMSWSRDLFGNSIATIHLLGVSNQLVIRSNVVVVQFPPFPIHAYASEEPVTFPLAFSSLETAVALSYQATCFPSDVEQVRGWVFEVVRNSEQGDAMSAAEQMVKSLKKTFSYRRREEKGVQTPTETIASRSGSCRDLATLMLEGLRILGFPARFASGYLHCGDSEAGRASTHAWAEAYFPTLGWVGFDPTLGRLTDEQHVVTGVSSHPRGVMPIVGTFYGSSDQYLGMEVSVQTETLDCDGIPEGGEPVRSEGASG